MGRHKKKRISIICKYCKKEFKVSPGEKNRIYCSGSCRSKSLNSKKRISINCEYCKKEFNVLPSEKNKIYCNSECRNRRGHNRKLNPNKKRISIECGYCNKEFKVFPCRTNTVYCSYACRGLFQRKRELSNCLYCEKQFESSSNMNYKKIYCSHECFCKYTKKHGATDETKQKIRLKMIERMENRYGQLFPNYNPTACKFFEFFNKAYAVKGKHAENGGEYHIKELGYWVDFYEPTLNLVIEFYERHHYMPVEKLKEKDLRREKEIIEYLGCNFVRVNAYDKNNLKWEPVN